MFSPKIPQVKIILKGRAPARFCRLQPWCSLAFNIVCKPTNRFQTWKPLLDGPQQQRQPRNEYVYTFNNGQNNAGNPFHSMFGNNPGNAFHSMFGDNPRGGGFSTMFDNDYQQQSSPMSSLFDKGSKVFDQGSKVLKKGVNLGKKCFKEYERDYLFVWM